MLVAERLGRRFRIPEASLWALSPPPPRLDDTVGFGAVLFLPMEFPVRINGRTLRPSTAAERRLFLSLGTASIHVPRSQNPFRVARRIEQMMRRHEQEKDFLRLLAVREKARLEYRPSPELDLPYPEPTREPMDGHPL